MPKPGSNAAVAIRMEEAHFATQEASHSNV